jgi:hypothetical protein
MRFTCGLSCKGKFGHPPLDALLELILVLVVDLRPLSCGREREFILTSSIDLD